MKAVIKRVAKRFVEIDDVLIDYDEMIELVSEIKDTDGMFNAVTIYDRDMAKVLVDAGVADRNVRGSHYCKDEAKRKAFSDSLDALDFGS